jgi:5'-3' exonuclease
VPAAPPALLLDSASLYYRAFHALPESMTAPDGRPHNAVRGFLSTVTRLVDTYSPGVVVPCWDDDWRPAWRVALIPTYKTHRLAAESESGGAEAEPESLSEQADAIAELLTAMGIAPLGATGYEADDVIATMAVSVPGPSIAVSGDRDLVQLVSARARLLLTVNGGMDKWPLLDSIAVEERFGVSPEQYVSFAVLRGDPSDGLPGVTGIGAKTAAALVTAFGDLDGILRAARDRVNERPMTPRLAAALLDHEDAIGRARIVATAVTDLDVSLDRPRRDPELLAALAAAWGVGRQVDALVRALDSAGAVSDGTVHTADE